MGIIITFIVVGLLSSGAVLFFIRKLTKKSQESTGQDMSAGEDRIGELDQVMESAFKHVEGMVPLADARAIESKIAETMKQFGVEHAKLDQLEKSLAKAQKGVDTEEAAYNELKRGKDDAEQLADKIKADADRVDAETKRIENEIKESKDSLQKLGSEVALTADQKKAVDAIAASLNESSNRLKVLIESYSVASQRFVNLQSQYTELEKEYRKLVEKELSSGESQD